MSQLSPSEKRGLLILMGIILIGFVIQWLQPVVVKNDLYDYTVQDSLFMILSAADADFDAEQESLSKENVKSTKHISPQTKERVLLPHSININTAGQADFERLPRIGPATAKNILEYREKNGRFTSVDELAKVKRIGPKTLELISPYLTVK